MLQNQDREVCVQDPHETDALITTAETKKSSNRNYKIVAAVVLSLTTIAFILYFYLRKQAGTHSPNDEAVSRTLTETLPSYTPEFITRTPCIVEICEQTQQILRIPV
ncbi:MAG: hypothetical protein A3F11_00705 [Gammaproteobacteria bacterium RIFCSPHIGHO2_12_FULL_37_14]|nr:MAG: hypothetical protein A3F11_00705 [Gammaproteobacteria bacterium RIFCSPHIGHO2_12_FULL_37_14]